MKRLIQFVALFLGVLILGVCSAEEPFPATVDHQTVVCRADLVCDRPAETSDAGQPIGNGRMGTMVWTSPDAIHLQINRADVFAVNRDHHGPQFRSSAPRIAVCIIVVNGPSRRTPGTARL